MPLSRGGKASLTDFPAAGWEDQANPRRGLGHGLSVMPDGRSRGSGACVGAETYSEP